jgi:hypothetical protein
MQCFIVPVRTRSTEFENFSSRRAPEARSGRQQLAWSAMHQSPRHLHILLGTQFVRELLKRDLKATFSDGGRLRRKAPPRRRSCPCQERTSRRTLGCLVYLVRTAPLLALRNISVPKAILELFSHTYFSKESVSLLCSETQCSSAPSLDGVRGANHHGASGCGQASGTFQGTDPSHQSCQAAC